MLFIGLGVFIVGRLLVVVVVVVVCGWLVFCCSCRICFCVCSSVSIFLVVWYVGLDWVGCSGV